VENIMRAMGGRLAGMLLARARRRSPFVEQAKKTTGMNAK
jgi:hypothetical protein